LKWNSSATLREGNPFGEMGFEVDNQSRPNGSELSGDKGGTFTRQKKLFGLKENL